MGDTAVRVEGMSKQFRIGKQEKYRTFRETLTNAATAPFRRIGGLLRGNAYAASNLTETIWALKDISFEVKKGDVVGIIGRNGAGKSTLLKILSRITEPTTGRAEVYGRVGALLEVGTGFHPELTGRENIYLNGAILGMSRDEIRRKFDEIVTFAEVEKFIDTPVKHYSSGMGLRLGFAVAAHLEPEILIVDEVLAVGDAQFQKKCLGKMTDVAGEGRTVLFVSHNMAAVENLCGTTFLLQSGRLKMHGITEDVIRFYTGDIKSNAGVAIRDRIDRDGNGKVRFTEVGICDSEGSSLKAVQCGDGFQIRLTYESELTDPLHDISVSAVIRDSSGINLVCLWDKLSNVTGLIDLPPKGVLVCHVGTLQLTEGLYDVTVALTLAKQLADKVENAFSLVVTDGDYFGTGRLPATRLGALLIPHRWSCMVAT